MSARAPVGRIRGLLDELGPRGGDLGRLGILLVTCLLCAILLVDWRGTADGGLTPGAVAPRTVRAPFAFTYPDQIGWQDARDRAEADALPVWIRRTDHADRLVDRVAQAFAVGRGGGDAAAVGAALGAHLPDDVVAALTVGGWSSADETLAGDLLRRLLEQPIVADPTALPSGRIQVVPVGPAGAGPGVETDASAVLDLPGARRWISMALLESAGGSRDTVAALCRALVEGNLAADAERTDALRRAAATRVPLQLVTAPRGATLLRQGDVLTPAQIQAWRALQDTRGQHLPALDALFVGLFLLLLYTSLYQFGSAWLTGFHTTTRDVTAAGALLVLVSAMARLVVASSEEVAAFVGHEAQATSVWFAVPVAGAVMLVRLLLGTAWTVVFSVAAAVCCGLVMEMQALPVVFFLIVGVAAGSLVEGTRERASVVRAGFSVGLVGAAAALVVLFVQLFVVDGDASLAATIRPVWSTGFAFIGGISSSFLVLGLIPIFEGAGFVTDYRLMELANLNHPLLRQLMLRAPGTYHHSVLVGTLAEAACEAIGANALEAKVAAYFHDIGKSLKPLYFVENQNGVNRHASLDPTRSAQIIISHVTDGGRMAREHKLPQPIVDNIWMHHGTGLLAYFLEEARRTARPGEPVDEALFRYPGPKPSNREAGVLMLADKVEAATRTIRHPTEHNIRSMIHRIINSTIADGQFDRCPLTFREISVTADVFVKVLLGIHHQRIEYSATADLSRAPGGAPEPVITLEVPELVDLGERDPSTDAVDYESIEHLPRTGE